MKPCRIDVRDGGERHENPEPRRRISRLANPALPGRHEDGWASRRSRRPVRATQALIVMAGSDPRKPPVLRNRRKLARLIVLLLIAFALLYIGVGATAFFRTQPPPF